jgi:pimeloyl-ACP methyl ester carboxylesterase
LRDWPGLGRPLVHVPDPIRGSPLVETIAASLAPHYRVLSVSPRGGSPFQVDAIDLVGVLSQFGFDAPILLGERLGCVASLIVAAWYPGRMAGLVLIDPTDAAPAQPGIEARALRDCPPNWTALRNEVACPVLVARSASPALIADLEAFVAAGLP